MRKEVTNQELQNITDNAQKLGEKIIEAAAELEAKTPSIIYACMSVALFITKRAVASGIVDVENAIPMAEKAFKDFIYDDLQEFIDNYEKQQENG